MSFKFLLMGVVLGSLVLSGCNSGTSDEASAPVEPNPTIAEAPVEVEQKVASISGTVSLVGPVVQNTTLLMLEREIGELEYVEFERKPAADGVSWSFDDAVVGEVYEITAALQVDKNNVATGNVITTNAPAEGEVILINTDHNLSTPDQTPRLESCGNADGAGGYNATLVYGRMNGAEGYYYEVGTTSGGNDADKGVMRGDDNPSNSPEASVYIKGDQEYFTRYAFTECSNCNVYDEQNWSNWSPTLGFKCPG